MKPVSRIKRSPKQIRKEEKIFREETVELAKYKLKVMKSPKEDPGHEIFDIRSVFSEDEWNLLGGVIKRSKKWIEISSVSWS